MAKEFVGLRLPPDLIASIDALATEETRSRANAIERVLTSWFKEHRPDLLNRPLPYEDVFKAGLDDPKS
jgi:hypothetical protein